MRLLPSPFSLKCRYAPSPKHVFFLEQSRQTVRDILSGTDPRLLLIVGPCSIHDIDSAKEYATLLARLQNEVSTHFFILMRVYFEKPRTLTGWKGLVYDPALDGSHDMETGLSWARQLLIDLADLEVPAATEFLDPFVRPYLEDLIAWGSIGARTSTSQVHRQMAADLPMPVGIKNPIAGTLASAIQSVVAATQPHTLMGINQSGQGTIVTAKGNVDAHLVLRGWERQPNYDRESIHEALSRLQRARLPSRLLIDCSHDNSSKKHERQPLVFQEVIDQVLEGINGIRGMLLESFISAGSQPLTCSKSLSYGTSVTDSCLDWRSTEQLITTGAERMESFIALRQMALQR